MKCQKCAKPAVVHLTEVVTQTDEAGMGEVKRAVEIHLCLNHAVEAGLLLASAETPASEALTVKPSSAGAKGKKVIEEVETHEEEGTGAIVPAPAGTSSLAVTRGAQSADPASCPVCGMNWAQFKQAGLMGCAHDYEQFSGKLVPLLKRAQEGATEHVGKVPAKRKTVEGDRQVMTLRLRRELQQAVDTERYEQAAALRDQLRQLEQN